MVGGVGGAGGSTLNKPYIAQTLIEMKGQQWPNSSPFKEGERLQELAVGAEQMGRGSKQACT